MNRRVRFLAALLALIGFTAYFAESLVATSCMPDGAVMAEAAVPMSSHDIMHHPAPVPSDTESNAPDCPLGPMGGSSCVVAATLPAAASATRVPAPEFEQSTAATADVADELFVRTLFHPPRV